MQNATCCNAALYVGTLKMQIRGKQWPAGGGGGGEGGGWVINVNKKGKCLLPGSSMLDPPAPDVTITMATRRIDACIQYWGVKTSDPCWGDASLRELRVIAPASTVCFSSCVCEV